LTSRVRSWYSSLDVKILDIEEGVQPVYPLDEQGRAILARERAEALRIDGRETCSLRFRIGRLLIAAGAQLTREAPAVRSRPAV
jgi:hypothetical protein